MTTREYFRVLRGAQWDTDAPLVVSIRAIVYAPTSDKPTLPVWPIQSFQYGDAFSQTDLWMALLYARLMRKGERPIATYPFWRKRRQMNQDVTL